MTEKLHRTENELEQDGYRIDEIDLDGEQLAIDQYWRKKIAANYGELWVFVHPYFADRVQAAEFKLNYGESRLGFERVVRSDRPVLVLEEYFPDSIDKLKVRTMMLGDVRFLLLKTERADNTPYDYKFEKGMGDKREHGFWKLGRRLKDLGVRRVVLGGGYLLREGWILEGGIKQQLGGCVGSTCENLGKYLPIDFSAYTYPLVLGDII